MKDKINSYFAVLIITIFGAGAALIIMRVATQNTIIIIHSNSEASYAKLQQSILQGQ